MQYLIIAYDNDGASKRRQDSREEHLKNAEKLMNEGKIINAAALIENDEMVGSTLIINFKSEDEIDEWLMNEPYVKNNVWNMDEFQMVPIKLFQKK